MVRPKMSKVMKRGISVRLSQHSVIVNTSAATAAMALAQPRRRGLPSLYIFCCMHIFIYQYILLNYFVCIYCSIEQNAKKSIIAS